MFRATRLKRYLSRTRLLVLLGCACVVTTSANGLPDLAFEDGFEDMICALDADCSELDSPPLCVSPTTCQGTQERKGVCDGGVCVVMTIDNDSACTSDLLANDCFPYQPVYCSGGVDQDAPSCGQTCYGDFDCASGFYCDGQSTCQFKKSVGGACLSENECISGNCADGYCCDVACQGTCQSCDLPGSVGSCTFLPLGSDPDDECGPFGICDGAGSCRAEPDSSIFKDR